MEHIERLRFRSPEQKIQGNPESEEPLETGIKPYPYDAWSEAQEKQSGDTIHKDPPKTLDEPSLIFRNNLQRYDNLRREEKQLQRLVHALARQTALYGPLATPAQLQIQMEDEQEKLNQLRGEIEQLERELLKEQSVYDKAKVASTSTEKLNIIQQRITRLIIDIKQKRELMRIHETNIRFLEQKQAQFGIHAPLNVISEIYQLAGQIERVRADIRIHEEMLQHDYAISPEQLHTIDQLSNNEMTNFIEKVMRQMQFASSPGILGMDDPFAHPDYFFTWSMQDLDSHKP